MYSNLSNSPKVEWSKTLFDSLVGITKENWFRLLKENHFRVSPRYAKPILFVTLASYHNSRFQKEEEKRFGEAVRQTKFEHPPIFLIGHWRSGTTYLHNLISQDKRFAYPNLFEIQTPHSFLSRWFILEKHLERAQSFKRSMDNMRVDLTSPQEEEFALAVMTLKSPLIGWIFPKRAEYYDRYLSFKNVSKEEIDFWKENYIYFLKKLTFKHKRQLLLKSPVNTSRIKLLLDIFPEAKFVHIHRNPYDVIRSTMKLFSTAVTSSQLQKPDSPEAGDYIIDRYRALYSDFFEQKGLIPEKHYVEVSFEDLEKNPLMVLKTIYDGLNIDDFEKIKPAFEQYLEQNKSYKKNHYKELDRKYIQKINEQCKPCIEAWGYNL